MIEGIDEFRKELDAGRAAGRTVGLVPTMGALHAGHVSLIRRAVAECDLAAVTVFVNPLQFGPGEDLDSYPRDLDGDVDAAAAAGAGVVFAPRAAEMFPEGAATRVRVGGLGDRLEGEHRPGHFEGVATVVAKLFAVAGPCRAYFGEKDYQQLQVVRALAADLSFPVAVVGCPTVREADGLACSSRNARLAPPERTAAPVLHRALAAAAGAAAAGERDADRLRAVMRATVATEPAVDLEYAEVVDPATLAILARLEGEARLLVAARVGTTRLIDNVAARPGAGAEDREP